MSKNKTNVSHEFIVCHAALETIEYNDTQREVSPDWHTNIQHCRKLGKRVRNIVKYCYATL